MSKRILASLLVVLLVLSVCACSKINANQLGQAVDGQDYKSISAEEVKTIIGEKGVLFIDVREAEEYEAEHIDGASNLPLSKLLDVLETELPDKEAIIILYCGSGQRSAKAAGMLARKGYEHVFDMGGMSNWNF